MEHGGRHCGWDTRKAVAGGGTVLDGETGKGMELGLRDKEGCPEKGLHIYLYCFLSQKRKTK